MARIGQPWSEAWASSHATWSGKRGETLATWMKPGNVEHCRCRLCQLGHTQHPEEHHLGLAAEMLPPPAFFIVQQLRRRYRNDACQIA